MDYVGRKRTLKRSGHISIIPKMCDRSESSVLIVIYWINLWIHIPTNQKRGTNAANLLGRWGKGWRCVSVAGLGKKAVIYRSVKDKINSKTDSFQKTKTLNEDNLVNLVFNHFGSQ